MSFQYVVSSNIFFCGMEPFTVSLRFSFDFGEVKRLLNYKRVSYTSLNFLTQTSGKFTENRCSRLLVQCTFYSVTSGAPNEKLR